MCNAEQTTAAAVRGTWKDSEALSRTGEGGDAWGEFRPLRLRGYEDDPGHAEGGTVQAYCVNILCLRRKPDSQCSYRPLKL